MQGAQADLLIPELASGTVYGKHEILQRLAVGGMAEIYLARVRGTAGFEKLVVLKRILPHFAVDPRFVQMFLGEARLAASLQHPNIADVYDVGNEAGSYFFTMEFVHGQDVRSIRATVRKQRQGVPLGITLAIVHGAASALDYAHAKTGADGRPLGLVHRDVSTSNIMISYDGAVKLLDFGIARASTTSSAYRTETGALKGKIPYMSPEQCKGAPVDHRSDLFSLGVVLYELTVGQRPFRGESDFAIMDQIVNKGARSPRELIASYPEDLEAIVMKSLARDPSERYASAEEMLHDLEQAISSRGPWVSPKHLGKYMRQLFADRIAAWENAQQAGLTLAQHVIEPVTSPSQHPVTPASVPDLPTPRPSQLMAAAAPEIVGASPSFLPRVTPPSMPVAPMPRLATGPIIGPELPRSGRLRVIVIGSIAAVAALAIGIVATSGGSSKPSAPSETIQLKQNATTNTTPPVAAPAVTTPAAVPGPATTSPTTTPPTTTSPATPPQTAKKPPPRGKPTPPKTKPPKVPTETATKKEEPWTRDSFSLPQ